MNRAAKKRSRKEREEQLHQRHFRRCETVLAPLGLADKFRLLDRDLKKVLWSRCIRAPEIVVNGAGVVGTASLCGEVQNVLETSVLEVHGADISLSEVWTVMLPLLNAFPYLVLPEGQPRIVERQGEEFLVEYRFLDHFRLGYFRVRRLPEKLLVKTFLFLTMQGTPEARQLHHRLRLQRPNIEYHGLDRLETYLLSDLREDPDLTQVLSGCGCKPLLEFLDAFAHDHPLLPPGYARSLKEYLRLPRLSHRNPRFSLTNVSPCSE